MILPYDMLEQDRRRRVLDLREKNPDKDEEGLRNLKLGLSMMDRIEARKRALNNNALRDYLISTSLPANEMYTTPGFTPVEKVQTQVDFYNRKMMDPFNYHQTDPFSGYGIA